MDKGTPIGRVRGLGSAHHGAHHWLRERFSGLASLIVSIYLLAALLLLPAFDYAAVRDWLVRPVPAAMIALFVLTNVWHARMGLQVVIDDYAHVPANRIVLTVLLELAAIAMAAFGLLCSVRLALGAA